MPQSKVVTRRKVVSLQYSLSNDNGDNFHDATSDPILYVHGYGALFPKLEEALEGRIVGDVVNIRLLPDDGFGKRDTDLVQEVPRAEIPTTENIQVGGQLVGTDTDGNELGFRITAIQDGNVYLDGNNPLAGQTLIFEIEVQGIRDATPEEIEQKKTRGARKDSLFVSRD